MTDTHAASPAPSVVEGVSRDTLRDIEHLAVELAGIAGSESARRSAACSRSNTRPR